MRNNDVAEILFPKSVLKTADKEVFDLKPGELGIFSEGTGKSLLAATVAANPGPVFIAVGLDNDADGATDDIRRSAGPNIQLDNVVYQSTQESADGQNMVVDITDLKTNCGGNYGIKVGLSNQQIHFIQGTGVYQKSFVAKAPDCNPCGTDCLPADTAVIVRDILLQVELLGDDFFKAEALVAGAVKTGVELAAIIVANAALEDPTTATKVGIRITANPIKVQQFCNVNPDYHSVRETGVSVTLVADLQNHAKVEVTKPLIYGTGSGYDIREMEFQLRGNRAGNEGAYREYAIIGLPMEVQYESDLKLKYDIHTLAYDHYSRTGSWLQYDKALATHFIIPKTDRAATVSTDLKAILAALTTRGTKDRNKAK